MNYTTITATTTTTAQGGQTVSVGMTMFNCHGGNRNSKSVGIVTAIHADGFLEFRQADGSLRLLTGNQLCSMEHAAWMRWV
tara:strand:+ start:129 stop:371 length:243 start_codon:yes stop_codon:yes gene_type:complete